MNTARRFSPFSPFALSAGVCVVALLTSLGLYVHRLMTNGDNLDYLFITWLTTNRDLLEPFRWRFPAAYSYLLSGWLWATGSQGGGDLFTLSTRTVTSAKLLGIGLVVPTFGAILYWLRQLKAPFPLLIGLLLATSQPLMVQFSIIGSEPLFIFLSLLSLALWERAVGEVQPSPKLWAAASACTLAAIQTRQIGMAIPVAVLSYLFLFRKRHSSAWLRAAHAAAWTPLILSFLLAVLTNPTYLKFFFANPETVETVRPPFTQILADNFATYGWTIPDALVPKWFGTTGVLAAAGAGTLALPLVVALYAILLLGVKTVLFRKESAGRISIFYVAASLLVFMVCPYSATRYAVPLLPVLLWLAVLELSRFGQALPWRTARPAALALLAWIGFQTATDVFTARKNLGLIWRLREQPPWHPERYIPSAELDFAGLLDAGEWIGAHAPADGEVVSAKALFVQISSRRSVDYPFAMEEALRRSRENGTALYVVFDSFPEGGYGLQKTAHILPHLQQENAPFELVYTSPYLQTKVYRYLGAGEAKRRP